MDRKNIGLKVKEERSKIAYSQQGLADSTNVSLRTIQRIEKGEETISKDTLLQVLEYLSIEYSDDGFIAIPELNSVSDLINNLKKYELYIEKGDFSISELEIILKLAPHLNNFTSLDFEEEIKREIELRKILDKLDKLGIKLYMRLKYDANIQDNREVGYGIWIEEYKELHLYIYKLNSHNVLVKRNKKTYISILNDNYSNLYTERERMGISISEHIAKYPNLFTSDEINDYHEAMLSQEFPF